MALNPAGETSQVACHLATLVAEIAQGDESALGQLYDATSRLVYGMALRMVRDTSAAEDITLEVFLQVWRTATTFSLSRGSVVSWLAMLAHSRSLDWLRSPQARFIQQSHPLDEMAGASGLAGDPEHASVEADRGRALRKGMGELPAEQRQIIELAYFSGFSHSEIAGRLGLPLGTVKTRIRLGMSRLRESLLPYMEGAL